MTQAAEKNEVSIKVPITNEFLGYVASTAIECEGAIGYWVNGSNYNPDDEVGNWLTCSPADPDDDFPPFQLDRKLLLSGIQIILDEETNPVNRQIRKTLIGAVVNDDAGDVDAEVADCIVQAGAFGELVYS